MGLGCLNPGKCKCEGGICWDCPVPLSYTVSCSVPCFSGLNGTHVVTQADFESIAVPCLKVDDLPQQELYIWALIGGTYTYIPATDLYSGDFLYQALCSGGAIDQTVNPQRPPTSAVLLDDVVVSARRTIALESPSRVSIGLEFYVLKSVYLDWGTSPGFGGAWSQQMWSKDYFCEFKFQADLVACAGQTLPALQSNIMQFGSITTGHKGWGNVDPLPSSAGIAASDFTVSIQMT
ncbi:MAG: hypothetical protein Aurels2KO_25240 [Aureliella sp.]